MIHKRSIRQENPKENAADRFKSTYYYSSSSSENIFKNKIKKKRFRSCKKDIKERNFICDICQKTYLSFPALYTHKRNKHNVIPITGKENVFKSFQFNTMSNFNYSSFGNILISKEICEIIMEHLESTLNEFYLDENSCLYQKDFEVKKYPLLKFFTDFLETNKSTKIPNPKENKTIDQVLVIYLILMTEVTREKFFILMTIRMVILLREYMNLVGWENLKSYHDYNIYTTEYVRNGDYCDKNDCEEIPGLIDDFVSIYLEICETLIKAQKKDFYDLIHNFCYWLFINDLTNFKVVYVDEN